MASGLSLVLALALGNAPAADSSERVVTKASVYLAKDPSFLSPRASGQALQRGDKVKVEGAPKGAWLLVTPKKKGLPKGYLHVSSVSDRPVAFRAEDKDVQGGVKVSGNYNLAVPGFSAEVAERREASKKEAKRGYDLVSRYMPMKPSPKQSVLGDPKTLLAFATTGRLREPGTEVVLGTPPPEAVPAPATAVEAQPSTPESPAAAVGATSPAAAAAKSEEKRPAAAPSPAATPAAATNAAPAAAPASTTPAAGVDGAPAGPASDPSEWTNP